MGNSCNGAVVSSGFTQLTKSEHKRMCTLRVTFRQPAEDAGFERESMHVI